MIHSYVWSRCYAFWVSMFVRACIRAGYGAVHRTYCSDVSGRKCQPTLNPKRQKYIHI